MLHQVFVICLTARIPTRPAVRLSFGDYVFVGGKDSVYPKVIEWKATADGHDLVKTGSARVEAKPFEANQPLTNLLKEILREVDPTGHNLMCGALTLPHLLSLGGYLWSVAPFCHLQLQPARELMPGLSSPTTRTQQPTSKSPIPGDCTPNL